MKKYENQLPQAGRGNVHVAYQGKAIDQMIYDFMEEQGEKKNQMTKEVEALYSAFQNVNHFKEC